MGSLLVCMQTTPPPTPVPPCTRTVGPWVMGPLVPGTWSWVLDGTVGPTPATGGYTMTCNYVAQKVFTQTRSATVTRTNCTTYTCTQIRFGTVRSAILPCATWYTTGTPVPGCPPNPTCAGPATGTTTCAAVTPTVWNAWVLRARSLKLASARESNSSRRTRHWVSRAHFLSHYSDADSPVYLFFR